MNVTPGYISNVENGRTAMSLRMLIYYAKLMGITLDALVGQLEPEYKSCALDNALLREIYKLDETINYTFRLYTHFYPRGDKATFYCIPDRSDI